MVFGVLMARKMEKQVRCNNLLTVIQSRFRRHHCTAVTKGIRLSMEDGQVTVLLLLEFLQAFDMVVRGQLQNAQNYSVGAGMLVGSYLCERPQFVRDLVVKNLLLGL
jgi:hypothetical protein